MSALLNSAFDGVPRGFRSDDPDANATVEHVERLRAALQALYDEPLSLDAARAVRDLL